MACYLEASEIIDFGDQLSREVTELFNDIAAYSENGNVNIILFEGAINNQLEILKGYTRQGAVIPDGTSEKSRLLIEQQPTLTERIGQVGTHEGEHATNPNARSTIVGEARAENQANQKEIQAIRETVRPVRIPSVQDINFH